MNVTECRSENRKFHNESCLQMVSAKQREYEGAFVCKSIAENNNIVASLQTDNLLEKILHRDNFNSAYKKVKANKGAGGVDGLSIDELLMFIQNNGQRINQQIVEGKYKPKPIRRVEIPKEEKGKFRKPGIPTAAYRVYQQAITQVLTPIYEEQFS